MLLLVHLRGGSLQARSDTAVIGSFEATSTSELPSGRTFGEGGGEAGPHVERASNTSQLIKKMALLDGFRKLCLRH
jgi:hypothetical protein